MNKLVGMKKVELFQLITKKILIIRGIIEEDYILICTFAEEKDLTIFIAYYNRHPLPSATEL